MCVSVLPGVPEDRATGLSASACHESHAVLYLVARPWVCGQTMVLSADSCGPLQ